jgi:cytidylate kinase
MLIAIDGTASSGKGTVARLLAASLGLIHIDSGKVYRAVALSAHKAGVRPDDSAGLLSILNRLDLQLLDDPNLSGRLAGQLAAQYSPNEAFRAEVTRRLREVARSNGNVVMDGRDIGTEVLPFADVKIFVDGDPQVRAARRARELARTGISVTTEDMLKDITERDNRDRMRAVSPMRPAVDAMILNTSELDVEGTFREALRLIEKKLGLGEARVRSAVP